MAEWPTYPGETRVAGQHIIGAPSRGKPGAHITWDAFHTNDPIDKVTAFFESWIGRKPEMDFQGCPEWKEGDAALTLLPPGKPGPWGTAKVPEGGTVLLRSSIARPS